MSIHELDKSPKMKVQMRILHIQTGSVWKGKVSDMTEEELKDAKSTIKDSITHLSYCVIKFEVWN